MMASKADRSKQTRERCPDEAAWNAIADHVAGCHPCGMIWAGIGITRYEHCAEYRRLVKARQGCACTCKTE